MKRRSYVVIVLIALAIASLACGAATPTATPTPPPTNTPPPPPTNTPLPPTPTDTPEPATGGLDWTLDPNFGEADLQTGFLPDPYTMALTSGGTVDVSTVVDGCTGFATSQPDLNFYWTGSGGDVRIFFVPDNPGDDTTLIINDASANWLCNDDAYGLNPGIDLTSADSGWYAIWIGSYTSGEYISGTIYITEMNITPDDVMGGTPSNGTGGTLDWTLDPNFGEVDLQTGFSPDPYSVSVTSGGGVDASTVVDGCTGFATSQPDLNFYWTGNGTFLRFYFVPDNPGDDTTLIINGPSAGWYCNDDSFGGLDPSIDFQDGPDGWYAIWIGSYSSTDFVSGTLNITEVQNNHP